MYLWSSADTQRIQIFKVGVILVDLQGADLQKGEQDLERAPPDELKRNRVRFMLAINGGYGKGTVESAATGRTGPQRLWEMKQEHKTPQYTTRLQCVPVV
jgi:DNA polymerase V